MQLYHTYAWSLGIAGICYNVSHWILAVQYWSLSTKLEAMLDGQSMKTFTNRLRWLFLAGLLLNISTGLILILTAYYKTSYPSLKYWRDWLNLTAAAVSNIMLIDALRRLKKIVKGVFAVDTWQMILHVSAYLLVFVSGVILLIIEYGVLVSSPFSYANKEFYKLYRFFIFCVFLSQLPFSYIIYRLIN